MAGRQFEFATAGRIMFGAGKLREAGPAAAAMGRRALLVVGAQPPPLEPLIEALTAHQVDGQSFHVPGEPTTDLVRAGAEQARQGGYDLVVGFGGGSVMDTAKAVAILTTNQSDVLDYLEVIGRGRPVTRPGLPVIAIPTTAGTGAEVTRNAVLGSPPHQVKVSLRSPLMLPRVAIVDPELTYTLPPAVTASTGLDALTQLIEPYVSLRANPITDAFCRQGIPLVAHSLLRACQTGDPDAREDMSLASLLGGLALANAGLGAAHGFAGPIGGLFSAPHGAVCARLLPPTMATNVAALQARQPESPALQRFDEVARLLTGNPEATAADGVAWVADLVRALQVPSLATYGITEADLPVLVEKSTPASSMKANPLPLTGDEMTSILLAAL